MPISVRPWNAPVNAITPGRPVAARAIGAGREEGGLLRIVARRALVDLLGQLDIRRVRHDLIRGVGEMIELVANRGHDLRMAMPRVAHRDARGEVDEAAAFDVPQFRVLGAFCVEIAHHPDAARRGGVLAALQFGIFHRYPLAPGF
jgi:ParB family chromosome partitioning protein